MRSEHILPQHSLDPCDNFVTGRVGWFVEIYDTRRDVRLEITLEWRAAIGNWSEVSGTDEYWTKQSVYVTVFSAPNVLTVGVILEQ